MYRNLLIFTTICLTGLFLITPPADAQAKVTGPWMWMITPDSAGCGAAATDVDEIDEQTGGKLTEEDVAKNGISSRVLKVKFKNGLEWTEGEIAPTGSNNLNDAIAKIGLGAAGLNNHCAYAVINADPKNLSKVLPLVLGVMIP